MSNIELPAEEYSDYLLSIARAPEQMSWTAKKHPNRDALTIHSPSGYVIHPNLGFVNDDADAKFIATFDPPMVVRLLERLHKLEDAAAPAVLVPAQGGKDD